MHSYPPYRIFTLLHIASEIFSVIEDILIVTDDNGRVYQLRLSHTSDEDEYPCQQLPSNHQPGKKMYLFRLGGMMNPKGYLSSVGRYSTNNSTKMCYKNNYIVLGVRPFACIVLLGLRAGYQIFQSAHDPYPPLYFTTWAFPDKSLCT